MKIMDGPRVCPSLKESNYLTSALGYPEIHFE